MPNWKLLALIVVLVLSVSWLAGPLLAETKPVMTVPAVIVLLGARMTVPAERLKLVVLPSPLPIRKFATLALKLPKPERSSVARPLNEPAMLPWRMSAVALVLFSV